MCNFVRFVFTPVYTYNHDLHLDLLQNVLLKTKNTPAAVIVKIFRKFLNCVEWSIKNYLMKAVSNDSQLCEVFTSFEIRC